MNFNYWLILLMIFTSCKEKVTKTYDCTQLKDDYTYEGFYEENPNGKSYTIEGINQTVLFSKYPTITFDEVDEVYMAERFTGEEVINVKFTKKGSKEFYEMTKRSIDKYIAIFIQDELVVTPRVMAGIDGGVVEIMGHNNDEWKKKIFEYLSAKVYCNKKDKSLE